MSALLLRSGTRRRSATLLALGLALAVLAALAIGGPTFDTVACPRGCEQDHANVRTGFLIALAGTVIVLLGALAAALFGGSIALLQHVPGFGWLKAPAEEKEGDAVGIRANGRRLLLLLVLCILFTTVSVWTVVKDPSTFLGWCSLLFFGVGGAFWTYRLVRAGVFTRAPVLVVGRAGIQDNRLHLTLPWEDVSGLELTEQYTRGGTLRYLGIRTKRPRTAGHPRLQRTLRVLAPNQPELALPLSDLAVDAAEVVRVVRRYWDGPIAGLEVAPATRPRAATRGGAWAAGWWALPWDSQPPRCGSRSPTSPATPSSRVARRPRRARRPLRECTRRDLQSWDRFQGDDWVGRELANVVGDAHAAGNTHSIELTKT